jgi:L-malate glycosyltransferase
MKIIHLLAFAFDSGPADFVIELALAQRARGHQVQVCCDRTRPFAAAESLLLPRLQLHDIEGPPLSLGPQVRPCQWFDDIRWLRKLSVDVVHVHGSHDHFLAASAELPSPLIRSVHAPRSLSVTTPHADGWSVPTRVLARRLLLEDCEVVRAPIASMFEPVPRHAVRRQLGLPLTASLVGLVSTMKPSRRLLLALQVLPRLASEVHLVFVGDGVEEPTLRRAAAPFGSRVTFAGYQGGPAFLPWLQAVDEVWVLGLGNDFTARAAAQAKACGARVVAVDEGALGEYADALVTPDVDSLAQNALRADRRPVRITRSDEVAGQFDALYERAQRRR